MNCAIIGFGSIGSRHYKVLKDSKYFKKIYVISSRKKKKYFYNNLNHLINKEVDYFVVSNETYKHWHIFNFIEKYFLNKKVLIEKPLFHKYIKINSKIKNKYYVGYNLRFNPAVNFAKRLFINKKVYYLDMFCRTYLPNWRKSRDYSKVYSSHKNKGGGVLNDLSHELDLMNYFFGKYKVKNTFCSKISNLKINSEDICNFTGKFNKNIFYTINLNFFSRIESRKFLIASNDMSAEINLINNEIIFSKNNVIKKKIFKVNRSLEYLEMHKSILFKQGLNACDFKEGNFVLKIIQKIKK